MKITKRRSGYLYKRGAVWYLRYVINSKPIVQRLTNSAGEGITDKREAEAEQAKIMAPLAVADQASALRAIVDRIDATTVAGESNPKVTLETAWEAFESSPTRPDSGEATLHQYKLQWEAFVDWAKEKHPGVTTLGEVTRDVAHGYAKYLTGEKLAPNTYNKHLNTLALVFRVLQHEARLTTNFWTSPENGGLFERKTLVTNSRRELSVEELRNVVTSADGELYALFALGTYTGMRLGDCCTLRKHEVDLINGVIKRVPRKTARQKPENYVEVPISDTLLPILVKAIDDSKNEYVLPGMAATYLKRRDDVTDRIQKHFIKCGIKTHKEGTGINGKRAVVEVGFHSLRHTFVTLSRQSNVPLIVVEKLVGHSNPAMTRHYSHSNLAIAQKAVSSLPSVIDRGTTPVLPVATDSDRIKAALAIVQSMDADNWQTKQVELIQALSC